MPSEASKAYKADRLADSIPEEDVYISPESQVESETIALQKRIDVLVRKSDARKLAEVWLKKGRKGVTRYYIRSLVGFATGEQAEDILAAHIFNHSLTK